MSAQSTVAIVFGCQRDPEEEKEEEEEEEEKVMCCEEGSKKWLNDGLHARVFLLLSGNLSTSCLMTYVTSELRALLISSAREERERQIDRQTVRQTDRNLTDFRQQWLRESCQLLIYRNWLLSII